MFISFSLDLCFHIKDQIIGVFCFQVFFRQIVRLFHGIQYLHLYKQQMHTHSPLFRYSNIAVECLLRNLPLLFYFVISKIHFAFVLDNYWIFSLGVAVIERICNNSLKLFFLCKSLIVVAGVVKLAFNSNS